MDKVFKLIILTLVFSLTLASHAQSPQSVDYFAAIKHYDLSKLWRADSIQINGDGDKLPFPKPLGYIGDNYQRFYIHYITVNKSKDNPYQYEVYGKTKVKSNICNFKGTITVTKAILYKEGGDPRFKQGAIICNVTFYKDSTQTIGGIIKGTLTTGFYLDQKGKIYYDALVFVADGFSNNECSATWTSCETGKTKKCNWGDFRIPNSGDLDIGAGEFSVADKYLNYGWGNYKLAWGYDDNKPEVQKARQKENAKWWK